MDIFITGASGYIGSAVARALVARGHRVRGLARSDASEAMVRASGADPVRGSLYQLDVLARAAAAGDGVVHTAATTGEDRAATDASWSLAEARAAHGLMAEFLAADAALDATKLRALGWSPSVGEALGGICGALRDPAQGYTGHRALRA